MVDSCQLICYSAVMSEFINETLHDVTVDEHWPESLHPERRSDLATINPRRFLLEPRPSQLLSEMADLHDRFAYPQPVAVTYVQGYSQNVANAPEHLQRNMRAEMMFWPFGMTEHQDTRTRQTLMQLSERDARRWMVEVAKDLFSAVPYQITADMVEIIQNISMQEDRSVEHIESAELPSEAGYMWFDIPILMYDFQGRVVSLRAISWNVIPEMRVNTPTFGRSVMPGVRVVLWNLQGDPNDWGNLPESATTLALGPLQFDHIMVFPFGERFDNREPDIPELVGGKSPLPEGRTPHSALHFTHIAWQLMQTEIPSLHRQPPDKHTTKRLAARRSIKHGEVSVVTLRRTKAVEVEGTEHRDVDWTCTWLVTGHWRHLGTYDGPRHHFIPDHASAGEHPVCLTCGLRGTWIKPYVKGPDGLPLKDTRKLYRLSR